MKKWILIIPILLTQLSIGQNIIKIEDFSSDDTVYITGNNAYVYTCFSVDNMWTVNHDYYFNTQQIELKPGITNTFNITLLLICFDKTKHITVIFDQNMNVPVYQLSNQSVLLQEGSRGQLYNLSGSLVSEGVNGQIPLVDIPFGVYILRVTNGNKTLSTKLIHTAN